VLRPSQARGGAQGVADERRGQAFGQAPADDLARVQVQNDRQVHPALARPDVRDVAAEEALDLVEPGRAWRGEPMTLLSNYRAEISLPGAFVFPVIAAFRVFIRDGQWVEPLDGLWEKFGPKTIATLWET
jgi:hypothetical protein